MSYVNTLTCSWACSHVASSHVHTFASVTSVPFGLHLYSLQHCAHLSLAASIKTERAVACLLWTNSAEKQDEQKYVNVLYSQDMIV